MTLTDKQKVAEFLDICADYVGSGFLSERIEYQFDDLQGGEAHGSSKDRDSLEKIAQEINACKGCALHEKRLNAVPGEGVLNPHVLVIGEGPGEEEDKQGRPFVGKAGQFLDKMLSSIGLSRNTNCFIANVVKCRPPGNRDPHPEETLACAHFLERQISILKPRFILAAGKVSSHVLLKTSEPIGKLRGRFFNLNAANETYPLLCTYHPSALLRDESYKRPAWEDLKLLKSRLDN